MEERVCEVLGCGKPIHAKGLCQPHYRKRQKELRTERCLFDDCDRPVDAKGLCHSHYMRQYRGSTRTGPINQQHEERTCEIPGCDKRHLARGLCRNHYMEDRRMTKRMNGSNLNEDKVRHIWSLYGQGYEAKDIALFFGVHDLTITDILDGKTWGHVE